uniref:C2H2-type domain-containing protein n=1 Tax=Rhodnius prolixus TaxID=13249 RepID=T1I1E0_RHOPR
MLNCQISDVTVARQYTLEKGIWIDIQGNVTSMAEDQQDLSFIKRQQHVCPVCSKSYSSKSSLVRHKLYECGVEPQFQCPHCPYRCKQKVHLQKHMFRKKIKCAGCQKPYKNSASLRYHQKYECGIAPRFACSYCSYKAKRNTTLKTHMLLKHSELDFMIPSGEKVRPKSKLSVKKYLTKEDKNKDRSIQSRDETELREMKKFACDVCQRSYTYKRSLWGHKKYECGNEPRFFCTECQFATKYKRNLVSHFKKKHKPPDDTLTLLEFTEKTNYETLIEKDI